MQMSPQWFIWCETGTYIVATLQAGFHWRLNQQTTTWKTYATHRSRMEIWHWKANLLVWLETSRRREHLTCPSQQYESAVGCQKTYFNPWWLKRIFWREQEDTMILSAGIGRIRRTTLQVWFQIHLQRTGEANSRWGSSLYSIPSAFPASHNWTSKRTSQDILLVRNSPYKGRWL